MCTCKVLEHDVWCMLGGSSTKQNLSNEDDYVKALLTKLVWVLMRCMTLYQIGLLLKARL